MGERVINMFGDGVGRIAGYLPHLVSAIVIFALGWAVSRVLAGVTQRLLTRFNFDGFISRRVHERLIGRRSPTLTARSIIYGVGMLITASLTAQALLLTTLAAGIDRILAFIPHLLVGGAIMLIGVGVSNFVGRLLLDRQIWVQRGAKAAILIFTGFMALDELGVARGVVTTAFIAALGAGAIAAAIAFGVGNIKLAGEYTRRGAERAEEELARRRTGIEEPPYQTH